MRLTVSQVYIDGETGAGVPAGSRSVGRAGLEPGPPICRRAGPNIIGVTREGDAGVSGQAGAKLADVISVRAICRLPSPLGSRIFGHKGGGTCQLRCCLRADD